MISHAMLMAAGLGTRMQPFSNLRAKPLLPLMGVPVAQFAVDSLCSAGVTRIVANVHHDPIRTRSGLLELESHGADIVISDEGMELLGSAGGIRNALSQLGEGPFFVSNSDVLCDIDWEALASCHQKLREQWGVSMTLTLFPSGPVGNSYREILFDPSSRLITGLGTSVQQMPFFIGAAILEPEIFESVPEVGPSDFVKSLLVPAIEAQRAGAFLSSGSWYDVGSPALWLNTHLALMDRLEGGHFPNPRARQWRKRLESANHRVGDRSWISKSTAYLPKMVDWAAPWYWDGHAVSRKDAPPILGPQAVLYGNLKSPGIFERGIGFGGEWVSCR